MKYYPINLNLKDRRVLLVGAGEISRQKLKALIECRAKIHVVSPEALPDIQALARDGKIKWSARSYETSDLDGASLVIAATDDPVLQKKIAEEARQRGHLGEHRGRAAAVRFHRAGDREPRRLADCDLHRRRRAGAGEIPSKKTRASHRPGI